MTENWGLCPFGGGSWVPIQHNAAWAEVYLPTSKWHLDRSSRLTTTDMGRKLGAAPPPFGGGEATDAEGQLDPHLHNVALAEAYLHAKFHLHLSNRLATIHQYCRIRYIINF